MAIDIMIMPLSKYFSGDYITPAMKQSWDQNIEYSVVYPDETVTYPKGMPWGGENASDERNDIIPHLNDAIESLPFGISEHKWDEGSENEPVFYRLEVNPFDQLCNEFEKVFVNHEISNGDGETNKTPAHFLNANIFLPAPFPNLFKWIDELQYGSVITLKEELVNKKWSSEAEQSCKVFNEAIETSIKLNLPLIIDA